ncbi:MAG: hypothetical protein ACK5NA_09935 [Enterococcus sp.]
MSTEIDIMTLGELKKIVAQLDENQATTDETKVFLNTGWDSIQEIAPDAFSIEKAKSFEVKDVLTNETFSGYSLVEKAEKMSATGEEETIIVIQNLY